MTRESTLDGRTRALREAFDEGFARPERIEEADRVPLLFVTAGALRVALPLVALRRVARCEGLTRLPNSDPVLLGLAGGRGRILPVFSLGRILSPAASFEADDVTWIAEAEVPSDALLGGETYGLAFGALARVVRVSHSALRGTSGGEPFVEATFEDPSAPLLTRPPVVPVVDVWRIGRWLAGRAAAGPVGA